MTLNYLHMVKRGGYHYERLRGRNSYSELECHVRVTNQPARFMLINFSNGDFSLS